MKRNIIITTAMLLIFPTALLAQDKGKKELSTVRFETSIDCDHCVSTIMKNIPYIKGVKDVKCDLPTKEVTIVYQKTRTKPELLKRELEKLGYTAKELAAKEKKTT